MKNLPAHDQPRRKSESRLAGAAGSLFYGKFPKKLNAAGIQFLERIENRLNHASLKRAITTHCSQSRPLSSKHAEVNAPQDRPRGCLSQNESATSSLRPTSVGIAPSRRSANAAQTPFAKAPNRQGFLLMVFRRLESRKKQMAYDRLYREAFPSAALLQRGLMSPQEKALALLKVL